MNEQSNKNTYKKLNSHDEKRNFSLKKKQNYLKYKKPRDFMKNEKMNSKKKLKTLLKWIKDGHKNLYKTADICWNINLLK